MNDWYLSNVTVIQTCLIAVLLALSMQVTMRVGLLSVAGIGFYGVGAYATGILVVREYLSPGPAIVISALACGVLSYVLALLLHRVRGLYLTMVTLACVLILNVVASNGGELTGGPNGLYGVPISVTTWHIALVCLVAVAIAMATQRGPAGRASEALRSDELLAASVGIEGSRYRRANLVLSGILGGLAGGLNVLSFGTVNPFDAGFPLTVTVLTAVIVGGRRSWLGAAIGAVLITALPTVLSSFSGVTRDITFGALVILLATFAPDGLAGFATAATGWVRRLSQRNPVAVDGSRRGLADV